VRDRVTAPAVAPLATCNEAIILSVVEQTFCTMQGYDNRG
jgi:hypothetical protein